MSNEQQQTLANLLEAKEELHPDLKQYMMPTEGGLQQIKHPLSCILLYSPELNAVYNEAYRQKSEAVTQARAKKDWRRFVFLHERPYRLDTLSQIQAEIRDAEYWSILGEVWADCENLFQFGALIPTLVGSERPKRDHIMLPSEKRFLESLPDEVVVYRGYQARNKLGWSWSLSYWNARWFSARENPKHQHVLRGKVKKSNIIAVMTRRREFECIIDPVNVRPKTPLVLHPWVNPYLEKIALEGANKLLVDGPFSVHGLWHWHKVHWNVIQLCKLVRGADENVCMHFAYLHDCRRVTEGKDPDHGDRAAARASALYHAGKLDLNGDQILKLLTAIREHEIGAVSDDTTIGVCWDADRLDLMRVGFAPNPKLLSTAAAKELVWRI